MLVWGCMGEGTAHVAFKAAHGLTPGLYAVEQQGFMKCSVDEAR